MKFIRFAQSKMDDVPRGVVAVITSHAWIYNPTFRGMRQSLLNSFQQIHIIDLHGSTKPKEVAPEGVENENVFDIMKGVAITLFVKDPELDRGVWFGDVWGRRLEKYRICAGSDYKALAPERVSPVSPFYFISPHSSAAEWVKHKSLSNVFGMQSAGMVTARDSLNVAFGDAELLNRLRRFAGVEPEVAREDFLLGKDTRDWSIEDAQKDVRQSGLNQAFFRRVAYRPFDERFVYYTGRSKGLIGQPAKPLANSIDLSGIALCTIRRVEEGDFRHAFVCSLLPDGHSVSSKETTHVFPLFLPEKSSGVASKRQVIENLSPDFRAFIDTRYEHHYTPEEVLGYIYAVLHAPTYRTRYAEFLCIEFPRVPFPETAEDFEALSVLGWALVQAHLLRELPRRGLAAYHGKGDHTVEAVRYSPEEQAAWINKTQCFKPVPEAVWEFHIGGYQVLDKYLKSRKGRVLSLDEINHVGTVADSLAFTIDQMAAIDAAYRAAFPEQA